MCGIAFAIELLDAELEEEADDCEAMESRDAWRRQDMSGKELQRRVHAFPSKL